MIKHLIKAILIVSVNLFLFQTANAFVAFQRTVTVTNQTSHWVEMQLLGPNPGRRVLDAWCVGPAVKGVANTTTHTTKQISVLSFIAARAKQGNQTHCRGGIVNGDARRFVPPDSPTYTATLRGLRGSGDLDVRPSHH